MERGQLLKLGRVEMEDGKRGNTMASKNIQAQKKTSGVVFFHSAQPATSIIMITCLLKIREKIFKNLMQTIPNKHFFTCN